MDLFIIKYFPDLGELHFLAIEGVLKPNFCFYPNMAGPAEYSISTYGFLNVPPHPRFISIQKDPSYYTGVKLFI